MLRNFETFVAYSFSKKQQVPYLGEDYYCLVLQVLKIVHLSLLPLSTTI